MIGQVIFLSVSKNVYGGRDICVRYLPRNTWHFLQPSPPQSFPRSVPKVPNFASSGHAQGGWGHATTKVRRLQSLRPFLGRPDT